MMSRNRPVMIALHTNVTHPPPKGGGTFDARRNKSFKGSQIAISSSDNDPYDLEQCGFQ